MISSYESLSFSEQSAEIVSLKMNLYDVTMIEIPYAFEKNNNYHDKFDIGLLL